jgi:Zn finger protein HypA/HybF involved in hydrogenase expression
MEEVKYDKCPYCGSEETEIYVDRICTLRYIEMKCNDCKRHYICHFKKVIVRIK